LEGLFGKANGTTGVQLDPKYENPSPAVGVLGMPGFTGYMGPCFDIGQPKPVKYRGRGCPLTARSVPGWPGGEAQGFAAWSA